jgi:HAD superfamily hydrolase (TIGR01450 family)
MAPPILINAGPLLQRYDVLLCDVWGVVHNGRRAHKSTNDALARFRALGGTVILVSNAPRPHDAVAEFLAQKGVPRNAWDAIVASGDIALAHIKEQGYQRLHRIGPPGRDAAFFARLAGPPAPLPQSDAIVCTGLVDDRRDSLEMYRPLLLEALQRRLPLICANPDLVVDVGDERLMCAGAIADLYEKMGGNVFWAGKPHPSAYAMALGRAAELRGEIPDRRRVLAIGDAIRTDLAAAAGAGIDALFIASGIHNEVAMTDGEIDAAKLAALFTPGTPSALAAMSFLRW